MPARFLVIDDSLTLRQFIRSTLVEHFPECEVLLAEDGRSGLAQAQAQAPDLILLDFVLPDLKGDAVATELLAQPATAGLPVILMSSNVSEITRTQKECRNVVQALAKPFKAERLCGTIAAVLREVEERRAARAADPSSAASAPVPIPTLPGAPPATGVLFRASTAFVPVFTMLQMIESDRLTGVLRIGMGAIPLELHVRNGSPMVATIRDGRSYLRAGKQTFPPEHAARLEAAVAEQNRSGCPVPLHLAAKGVLEASEAGVLAQVQGWRLFSAAWSLSHALCDFSAEPPPDFVADLRGYGGSVTEWALESLRRVDSADLGRMASCRSGVVPAYTRQGYERLQQIALHDEEVRFAEQVNAQASLGQIAATLGIGLEAAQHILHRFLCLDVCDYWPAAYLQSA